MLRAEGKSGEDLIQMGLQVEPSPYAFGWHSSTLAVRRLKEAVVEIKAVAKSAGIQ